MNSIYYTTSPSQTMQLGRQLAQRLEPGSVVLLFGDLGSGKTHFTKGIAQGLGIEETIKSPTFTYVNMYQIASEERLATSEEQKNKKLNAQRSTLIAFHHYDLYRLMPGESFYSIGLEDTLNDPAAINVIEWADRMGENLPKNYTRVDMSAGKEGHAIHLHFIDSQVVPEDQVTPFWEAWGTPMHVREHCKQVAHVAVQIGQAFIKNNHLVDLNLVNTAALLHDMARICDFKTMHKEDFKEEITNEKWGKWLHLRRQYQGQHHPEIAFNWLSEKGYNKTAEAIRLHNSLTILQESEKLAHLETALVYYADKRVKHDEIVSLNERFRDGRERYGKYDDDAQKKLYLEVEEKTYELEKKLFEAIDLRPEAIR